MSGMQAAGDASSSRATAPAIAGYGLAWFAGACFIVIVVWLLSGAHGGHSLAQMISLVLAAFFLGEILGNLGGLLSCRVVSARSMVCVSLLIQGGCAAVLAMLGSSVSSAVLVLSAITIGVCSGLYRPAFSSLLTRACDQSNAQKVSARVSIACRIGDVAGPLAAGGLCLIGGSTLGFAFEALTLAIGSLLIWKSTGHQSHIKEAPISHPSLGLRSFLQVREKWIVVLVLQGLVQLLLIWSAESVLLPTFLNSQGVGSRYSLMLTLGAVGAIGGGIVASRIHTRTPGTVAVFALASVLPELACYIVSGDVWFLGLTVIIARIGFPIFGSLWFAAVCRSIPSHLAHSFFAAESFLNNVASFAGMCLMAWLVPRFGVPWVASVAIIALLTSTVVVLPWSGVRLLGDREGGSSASRLDQLALKSSS